VTPSTRELTTETSPTRARYIVLVFGVSLAVIAFMDRICLAQAAPLIARDLRLTKFQMGDVFGAFLLGYAVFGIPAAWFGDRVGPRKALSRIVVFWSLFAALTGAAWNFLAMATIQFLFGMGEAGCFPVITKSLTNWLSKGERTRAQGILWTAARWGGAFTPLAVVAVLRFVSWRWTFVVFGAFGVIWAATFYYWYRDNPAEHPRVNPAELALIEEGETRGASSSRVPWALLLSSRSVLLIALQYYIVSFSWYFYLTWLPTYLQEHHHLSTVRSARFAVFPLFFCGIGSLFCGSITPRVTRWTGSLSRTRRLMSITGFIAAAIFLGLSVHMPTAVSSMCLMATACFFNDWIVPHSWASCMDIGGRYASSVAGVMNLMGNLAGVSSSVLGGYLLQRTGNDWNLFVSLLAAVYVAGAFCWPFINPVERVEVAEA